jgi:hypothetical protein
VANTLAYYDTATIMALTSYNSTGPKREPGFKLLYLNYSS